MRKLIFPKTLPDLMNPARREDLREGIRILNALQRLRLVINSGGQTSESSLQVSGGAALLTGFAALGSPLIITQQPVGGTFFAPHDLTVSATGTPPIAYQWQTNAGGTPFIDILDTPGLFSGAQTATLSMLGPFPGAPWRFRCLVSNVTESIFSDVVPVEIL